MAWTFWATGIAPAEEVRIIYTDGRESERVPSWSVGETVYLSVNDVGRVFDATKQWLAESKQLLLRYQDVQASEQKTETATLTVESPMVVVGETAYQLESPIRLRRGIVQVPLDLVTEVLPRSSGRYASWDQSSRTLNVGRKGVNVGPLRFRRLREGVRATLTMARPLDYSLDTEAVGGLKLTVSEGRGNPEELASTFRRAPVERVSATQLAKGMEFLFRPVEGWDLQARVLTRRDPDRIVVDITHADHPRLPEPRLKSRWALSPDEVLGRPGEEWDLDLVVIDPGHGGIDGGARGPSGLEEKEVVLDIAARLSIMLEDRLGIEAVLTREDDTFVPLRTRTEMANTLGADLFISIHCNASRTPSVGGFEVYFQSLEMGEEEQLVAEFENAVLALESDPALEVEGDLPFILWDLAQNAFMVESSHLAEFVQEACGGHLPTKNRGVKQANFVVLSGAHMPAILVESAFTTNEREEALLKTAEFREQLAEGILEGIVAFKNRYGTGG